MDIPGHTGKPKRGGISSRAGQSLVELVVGLLAIVLVFIGILQIGRIAREHTQILMNAREEVDEVVIADTFEPLNPAPDYAWGVDAGADGRDYSQDDVVLADNPNRIIDDVVAHATPDELDVWLSTNAIADLQVPATFMQAFDLTYEQSASGIIEFYPIIRNLVAEDERLRMDRRVWMPWLRGLR